MRGNTAVDGQVGGGLVRGEQSGGGRAVERQRSRVQLRVRSTGCVSLSCCSAHGCHRRNDCSRMDGGVGAEGGGQQRRGGAHRRSAATGQQRRHVRSRCSSGHRHSGNRSSSGGRGRRSIDGVGRRITETSHGSTVPTVTLSVTASQPAVSAICSVHRFPFSHCL